MLGTELNRVVMHNVIGQHQGASRVVDSFFVWYNLLPKGREKNQNKRKEKKKGDEDCTESTLTKLSKQFFFL